MTSGAMPTSDTPRTPDTGEPVVLQAGPLSLVVDHGGRRWLQLADASGTLILPHELGALDLEVEG